MALFESYNRREKQILEVINKYGINTIEECAEICKEKGFDPYKIVEGIQPICFENAKWAYTVGCAIAIKKGCTRAKQYCIYPRKYQNLTIFLFFARNLVKK